jgi:hypothetical protein
LAIALTFLFYGRFLSLLDPLIFNDQAITPARHTILATRWGMNILEA